MIMEINRLNLKAFNFVLIFSFINVFFSSFVVAETPLIPNDPYSNESFEKIKEYYQIKNGLPLPQNVSLTETLFEKYKLQTIKLSFKNLPEVVFVLKLPLNMNKPLPAVVLFSGFQTGADAIQLVGESNSVVYVGFEYPWPIEISDQSLKWNWKRIEVIPILMALTISWLHQSNIIDHQKINIVNVSFGNLFYPLAQRILNQYGIFSRSIVFGYGGADISEIIGYHLQKKVKPFELEIAKLIIKNQTWMVEPKHHLPQLRGPYLIVSGNEDEVFSANSLQTLIDNLTFKPKIVYLPGGHIQPDRTEIISNFMNEVLQFLKESDAI